MSRELSVHFLPDLFAPEDLRGGIAVVIDVLRASTTICHALAAGAKSVVPCGEVEQARQLALNQNDQETVLGGERQGESIAGFDLDNSPLSYTKEKVAGQTILFTTTNGTRALLRSSEADRIVLAAFVNLNAVVGMLLGSHKPIHLVCAGTNGRITAEDCLLAGAIASAVRDAGTDLAENDPCRMAAAFFQACGTADTTLLITLRGSEGGRNLVRLGFDADIERAASLNLFDLVPEFFPGENRIGIAGRAESRTVTNCVVSSHELPIDDH